MGEAGFARSWEVEVLERAPLIAPARQYLWPRRVEGEEHAMERGALRLMVKPAAGAGYLLTCARGFAEPTLPNGVWGCPDADWMCAVAGGYAYLGRADAPEQVTQVELRPVTALHAAVEAGVLLLVGFERVVAWGREGEAWRSGRLSWDGVRVTAVEGCEARGFGWDLMADEEREFRLDLRTGAHTGGGYAG